MLLSECQSRGYFWNELNYSHLLWNNEHYTGSEILIIIKMRRPHRIHEINEDVNQEGNSFIFSAIKLDVSLM